jgi:hypothetical protein
VVDVGPKIRAAQQLKRCPLGFAEHEMDPTRSVAAIAGALMLLGGVTQLFAVVKRRRRAQWRGAAVSALAVTASC